MGSSSSKNANSQGHTQASSGAQHGKPTGPNELTRLKLREAELLAELEKVRVLEAGANRGAVGTKTIGSDPCNVSVNVSGVTLSTVLGHGTIATSTPTRVKALVTVRTEPPGPEAVRRAPVFVCVVLDKSGSMDGTKLTFAKKAATKLVKHLSTQDALHFVVYDSNASLLFVDGDLSDGGKRGLEQQIKSITSGSATNLLAAVNAGADALISTLAARAEGAPSAPPAACRIMLFSDGLVNAGETRSDKIMARVHELYTKHRITVSTFGIGTDFDEPLMSGIAETGRGHYTFLGQESEIPAKISASLHSLLELAGSDATVQIDAGVSGRVARVYGDVGDGVVTGGRTVVLPLDDLHADNTRSVLVEIDLTLVGPGEHLAVRSTLRYTPNGKVDPIELASAATITAAAGQGQVAEVEDGRVVAAAAVHIASDRDTVVMEYVRCRDSTRACEVQRETVGILEAAVETAGPVHGELVQGVLDAARANLCRLTADDRSFDADEYCLYAASAQMQSRRMSARCLRQGCDSDSDRDWSDGWSGDESALARNTAAPVIVRRHRRVESPSRHILRVDDSESEDEDDDGIHSIHDRVRITEFSNFRSSIPASEMPPPPYSACIVSEPGAEDDPWEDDAHTSPIRILT